MVSKGVPSPQGSPLLHSGGLCALRTKGQKRIKLGRKLSNLFLGGVWRFSNHNHLVGGEEHRLSVHLGHQFLKSRPSRVLFWCCSLMASSFGGREGFVPGGTGPRHMETG